MNHLLGIPYTDADCVWLTRLALRALFHLRTRDPRRFPEAWREVTRQQVQPGDVITYLNEKHMAALVQPGYVLETKERGRSRLVRIDRMESFKPRYWRPKCST